jgi:hypothetical protein
MRVVERKVGCHQCWAGCFWPQKQQYVIIRIHPAVMSRLDPLSSKKCIELH